jgi:SAM-dependent methyltransferase
MHKTSLENMRRFVDKYLVPLKETELKIVDLGSQDVNDTYKQFFENEKWNYVGVGIEEGKNVDLVIKDIYDWKEIGTGSTDIVISGQAFEHIEYIWLTIKEIARITKPGGLGCIIAPSSGPEHKYPLDCWRILPDGFRALAKYANLEVVYIHMTEDDVADFVGEPNTWKDTVLIFRKKQ